MKELTKFLSEQDFYDIIEDKIDYKLVEVKDANGKISVYRFDDLNQNGIYLNSTLK